MRIIDSHFHWWPRSVFEQTLQRSTYPRVERNANGGFDLCRNPGVTGRSRQNAEWFDLDEQLAHMDALGHEVDVICSIGPFSLYFSDSRRTSCAPTCSTFRPRCAGRPRWLMRLK